MMPSETPSARSKLVVGTLILLVLTIGFNDMLSLSSVDKLYSDSVAPRYRRIGEALRKNLEESLRSEGKLSISDAMLEEAKARMIREIPENHSVSVSVVMGQDGVVRYGTDTNLVGKRLPVRNTDEKNPKKKKSSLHTKYEDKYLVPLPVRNEENHPIATIVIAFGDEQVRSIHDRVFDENLKIMTIIIACAIFMLIWFDYLASGKSPTGQFPKRRIFTAIFVIIALAQLIFSGLNVGHIRKLVPLARPNEILFDSATVLLISFFFFVEMLIMFSQMIDKHFKGRESNIDFNQIRPIIFVLLFGTEIALSFVPIYMEQICEPIFGLSKDVILGLPISVKVMCTGFAFFVSGIWQDRRGWHEPFLTGACLSGLGLVYSWLASDAINFVISRAITGTGYGLFFMASQGFVMSFSDNNSKARGFSILFAALYAGIMCGNATGAMLSERIGYRPVFLVGAAFVFFGIAYTLISIRDAITAEKELIAKQPHESVRVGEFFRFLFDKNVFSVICLSSIPANIAMIGFGSYFYPLYLSRIGTSQSDIGRIYIIYGIFQIYIGPLLSKYVDSSENQKSILVTGGIVGSAGFLAFMFFEGIPASLIAIVLLGFSHSFVFVSQAAYLLKLDVTKQLGQGKAIATFRLMNRIGQTLGPIVLGWLTVMWGFGKGAAWFGVGYLIITVMFLLLTRNELRYPMTDTQRRMR